MYIESFSTMIVSTRSACQHASKSALQDKQNPPTTLSCSPYEQLARSLQSHSIGSTQKGEWTYSPYHVLT